MIKGIFYPSAVSVADNFHNSSIILYSQLTHLCLYKPRSCQEAVVIILTGECVGKPRGETVTLHPTPPSSITVNSFLSLLRQRHLHTCTPQGTTYKTSSILVLPACLSVVIYRPPFLAGFVYVYFTKGCWAIQNRNNAPIFLICLSSIESLFSPLKCEYIHITRTCRVFIQTQTVLSIVWDECLLYTNN